MTTNVNERSTEQSGSILPGLTQAEQETLRKVFSSPLDIPAEWKAWLISYLEANPPQIPIAQILGFTSFTAQGSSVDTAQNRTNGVYGPLATAGPTISDLPDGQYVIFHGCSLVTNIANSEVYQSVSVNGAGATDADSVTTGVVNRSSVFTAVLATLNAGSNTVTCVYRTDGGATLTAAKRKIIVIKFANL